MPGSRNDRSKSTNILNSTDITNSPPKESVTFWGRRRCAWMPAFSCPCLSWVLPSFPFLSSLVRENGPCSALCHFLILSETEHHEYFRWAWILHFLWIACSFIEELFFFILIYYSSLWNEDVSFCLSCELRIFLPNLPFVFWLHFWWFCHAEYKTLLCRQILKLFLNGFCVLCHA